MQWTPLPRGSFTGIDWSRPGATAGFDPYLVWAEADNFAGYGLAKPPRWLPLLIELSPDLSIQQLLQRASPAWLRVPAVYTSAAAPAGLRFCTARVRPEFFRHIRAGGSLAGLILRFELGLPVGAQSREPPGRAAPPVKTTTPLLKGRVMGLIDGGLAFANAGFLRGGEARTRHFWRQDGQGVGPVPAAMGYGHELDAAAMEAAMRANTFGGLVDEGAVYSSFGFGMEMEKRTSHGSHVLDIACGPRTVLAQIAGVPPAPNAPPSWALADDAASRCAVVAVQLDWDTVLDTSGGSMNVHVLDALMYILSKCANTARIAVNLSWGTLAGPHDGTSMLEAAMDQLIESKANRLQVVVPVSNSYQSRTHANATLAPAQGVELHWRVQPDDQTQSFVELWLPPGAHGISLQLTPPGRPALPPLAWGESGMWTAHGAQPLCAVIYPKSVATGLRGTCALIAVTPTASFSADAATAPAGVWNIALRNNGRHPVTFDAYIERDDTVIGIRGGARQSHFEDRWYDTSGNPGSFVDHPDNPTPIRRSGNFNSIATGKNTVSVGGTRVAGPHWALYSPRNPDPDRGRLQRPGVVKDPAVGAHSDENEVLVGLRGAGTRSGGAVRLVGTSDAAPQVTRDILNAMD